MWTCPHNPHTPSFPALSRSVAPTAIGSPRVYYTVIHLSLAFPALQRIKARSWRTWKCTPGVNLCVQSNRKSPWKMFLLTEIIVDEHRKDSSFSSTIGPTIGGGIVLQWRTSWRNIVDEQRIVQCHPGCRVREKIVSSFPEATLVSKYRASTIGHRIEREHDENRQSLYVSVYLSNNLWERQKYYDRKC